MGHMHTRACTTSGDLELASSSIAYGSFNKVDSPHPSPRYHTVTQHPHVHTPNVDHSDPRIGL